MENYFSDAKKYVEARTERATKLYNARGMNIFNCFKRSGERGSGRRGEGGGL